MTYLFLVSPNSLLTQIFFPFSFFQPVLLPTKKNIWPAPLSNQTNHYRAFVLCTRCGQRLAEHDICFILAVLRWCHKPPQLLIWSVCASRVPRSYKLRGDFTFCSKPGARPHSHILKKKDEGRVPWVTPNSESVLQRGWRASYSPPHPPCGGDSLGLTHVSAPNRLIFIIVSAAFSWWRWRHPRTVQPCLYREGTLLPWGYFQCDYLHSLDEPPRGHRAILWWHAWRYQETIWLLSDGAMRGRWPPPPWESYSVT